MLRVCPDQDVLIELGGVLNLRKVSAAACPNGSPSPRIVIHLNGS
jgi:hypothetical protein